MNLFDKLTLIEPPMTITPDSLLAEGRKRVRRRRLLTLTATPLALVGGGALAFSLLTGGSSTPQNAVVIPASTPTVTPAPTAPESTATPNPVVTPANTPTATPAPTVTPAPTAPERTAVPTTPSRNATSSPVTPSADPKVWVDCDDIGLKPNSSSMITQLRIYSSDKNGCSGATTLAVEVAKRGSFLDPPNTFTMLATRCSKTIDETALPKAEYRCKDSEENIITWTKT